MYNGAGILFQNEDKVLLGLRKNGWDKNLWSILGGGMENIDGGNLWKCALREAQEELAPHFLLKNVIFDSQHLIKIGKSFRWKTFRCQVKVDDSFVIKDTSEFHEIRMFKLSELPNNIHPMLKDSLKHFNLT